MCSRARNNPATRTAPKPPTSAQRATAPSFAPVGWVISVSGARTVRNVGELAVDPSMVTREGEPVVPLSAYRGSSHDLGAAVAARLAR